MYMRIYLPQVVVLATILVSTTWNTTKLVLKDINLDLSKSYVTEIFTFWGQNCTEIKT